MRTKAERIYHITSARRALSEDVDDRTTRYLVTMAFRTACFILCAVTTGWYRWVFAAGAIVLPMLAVMVANAGREPSGRIEEPTVGDESMPRGAIGSATRASSSDGSATHAADRSPDGNANHAPDGSANHAANHAPDGSANHAADRSPDGNADSAPTASRAGDIVAYSPPLHHRHAHHEATLRDRYSASLCTSQAVASPRDSLTSSEHQLVRQRHPEWFVDDTEFLR